MRRLYSPETVCCDNWQAALNAWKSLFPHITIIMCFLHRVLKIMKRGKKMGLELSEALDRAWNTYHAETKMQFRQRLRRFREWASENLEGGTFRDAILRLCDHGPALAKAYDHPGCARTSAGLDRLMDHQDRWLYQMRYFHGSATRANQVARAHALIWNFHPYNSRLKSPRINQI